MQLLIIFVMLLTTSFCYAKDYTVTIDDKYVTYLQERATEENLTDEELVQKAIDGLLKYTIKNKLDREVHKKGALTTDDMITKLKEMEK